MRVRRRERVRRIAEGRRKSEAKATVKAAERNAEPEMREMRLKTLA